MACVAFFIAALLAISFLSRSAESSVIRVLTILPYPTDYIEPSWNEGHDIAPAMNLAVEMINNRSDILSGHEIELVNENGGCDYVNEALLSFTSRVVELRGAPPESRIAGLIGPGCSASTLAVLPLVNREQVTLINIHGAGSHLVEDRTLYPNSLGILGSTRSFTDAVFALMQNSGWTRIAVLFEESRTFFFSLYQTFLDGIHSETNGTIAFASTVYSTYYPLSEIRDSGLRIIVVMAGPNLTQNIMCLAHHEGMLYPDYQWILVSREVSEFSEYISFGYDGESYVCGFDLLINTILKGNLLLNYQLRTLNNTTVTHSGLNFIEFSDQYKERLNEYNQENSVSATPSVWAPMYFDAIWALALAFNSSGIDIGSYHHGNVNDSVTLRNVLYSLDFDGVSGNISFNNQTGFVNRRINIYQVFNGEQTLIGYVSNGLVKKLQHPEYIPDKFYDSSLKPAALPVTVIFTMVTLTLAMLVIVVHIITIVYRKHASIKATSTSLNHFIYFGCYVWTFAILSHVIHYAFDRELYPKVTANFCQAIWTWLIPIGYTLMFSTVSARTWRLYRIFTHYLNPGPLISNKVLVGFIMSLLIIDLILATMWTVVDPYQIDNTTYSVAESEGALTLNSGPGCNCKYFLVWFSITYGYRIILLIITTILSLLTRNIHDHKFTTKFLRVFVYVFALVLLLGGSLYYLVLYVGVDPTIYSLVFDVIGSAIIILVLVLIFIPPVWPIVRGKCGPVYRSLSPQSSSTLLTSSSK